MSASYVRRPARSKPGAESAARGSSFISIFNRYMEPGGEENSVARIAGNLEAAGHRVTRFWRSSAEWLEPNAPARWKQPFLLLSNRRPLAELAKLHSRLRPDAWIVHNVLPVVSLGIYRLARELNVPVVQWLHNYRPLSPSGTLRAGKTILEPDDPLLAWKEIRAGTWRDSRLLTAWLTLALRLVRRRGDFDAVRAWVAISEPMRDIFLRGGLPASRVFTLQHSWELSGAKPCETDDGYFLFLGRMTDEKGVRALVSLWSRPELRRVPLLMAGDGPLMSELRGRTPPNVRLLGFVEGAHKRRLLAGCRAVLVPSLWPEPFGCVALEAFEHGKPVVCTPEGGLADLVADNETGRVIRHPISREWLDAILQLATDGALAQRLGLNGRGWLERNATAERWRAGFDKILGSVLSEESAI